ncbi:MAG: 4-hydroxy-3-methylbut-2-enyl diphosphate reductase [Rikenellaceae bacterium]
MKVEIDDKSGFCFGVVNAIKRAEQEIEKSGVLYSLGDIVHNRIEIDRLTQKGLITVSYKDIKNLSGKVLFIRAHGEPPSTYQEAIERGIKVIDATCPVVAKLQKSVKDAFDVMSSVDGQVVILGKHGHAEVVGLNGQIDNKAIIVDGISELMGKVDFSRPIFFLSQTTKPLPLFESMSKIIKKLGSNVIIKDTICRNVSNRVPHLKEFAKQYDLILFISGKESSNGKVLFEQCKLSNENSYKIEDENDISLSWLEGVSTIGICGATSTPRWLMEKVKAYLEKLETAS